MKAVSKTGKALSDITLDAVRRGEISAADIKISAQTLNRQAEAARTMHREAMAANFERAAEMVSVPDEVILRMYNLLRPKRATKQDLLDMAAELENVFQATLCATLVREAAEIYEKRGVLL